MDLNVVKDSQRTKQLAADNGVADMFAAKTRGRRARKLLFLGGFWLALVSLVTRNNSRAKTVTGAIGAITGAEHGGKNSISRLFEITTAAMLKIALGPAYTVLIVRRVYDLAVVSPAGIVSKIEVKAAQMSAELRKTTIRFREGQLVSGTTIIMALYDAANPTRVSYVVTNADTIRACLEVTDTPITQETKLNISGSDSPVWDILKDDTFTDPEQAIARLKRTL